MLTLLVPLPLADLSAEIRAGYSQEYTMHTRGEVGEVVILTHQSAERHQSQHPLDEDPEMINQRPIITALRMSSHQIATIHGHILYDQSVHV